MIHQGTDGLSCGLLMDGVFTGAPMSLHIPLHLSAIDRSSSLVAWVQSWCPESTIHTLTPAEWYTKGHGWHRYEKNSDGVPMPKPAPTQWLLWTPPPTAGRFAMDELAVSRHKRRFINHIFVCPRLFTSQWHQALFKFADVVLEIPTDSHSFWPSPMHELLVLGLMPIIPFSTNIVNILSNQH